MSTSRGRGIVVDVHDVAYTCTLMWCILSNKYSNSCEDIYIYAYRPCTMYIYFN